MAAQESFASEDVARFEEKVNRTVFLEDVAPSVTVATIRTALGQFGKVVSVQILASPLHSKLAPKRVLVEMATQREAVHAINEIQEHPFIMMKGVLRPVIARAAEATFYPERPSKIRKASSDNGSGSHVDAELKPSFAWVDHGDPDWDLINKQKQLAKKHVMEAQYLMQELRKEEEKLASEQEERAKSFLDKFALVDLCMKDHVVVKLSKYYGLRVNCQ